MQKTKQFTHASVFSGIGGPEVAAQMLGWKNLFHCEINPFGRQILDYWFPESESYGDITKQDFSKWRGKVNVLTGGFPCQPFSYAGQRRGEEDDRYLWPYMFKCIDQIKPDWVVAENVAGILTMVEQGEVSEMASQGSLFDEDHAIRGYCLRETFTLQRICDDLESHGYEVQPILIPACAVGAPHRRDRVFIVGHRNSPTLYNKREEEISQHLESQFTDGTKLVRDGRKRDVTYSIDGRIQGFVYNSKQCDEGASRQSFKNSEQNGPWHKQGRHFEWNIPDHCGGQWENFPTVSPIHRGNDGLPFSLDNLTVSSSKWRIESLKAYGNAIVPQVIYEIFLAIQNVEVQP